MISFTEIYDRFINLVDDPQLNRAYVENPIQFKKLAYNFLINGLSNFTSPPQVSDLLAEQENPDGNLEIFDGNGTNEYQLDMVIPDGVDVMLFIAEKPDKDGYVKNGKAYFSRSVSKGVKCAVEWYSAGAFTADLGKTSGGMKTAALYKRVVEILARCMVIGWADKEQNFMLDIRNLLNDTDFKLHSPANSLKSKMDWVNSLRFEIYTLQTKLDWDLRNITISYYNY